MTNSHINQGKFQLLVPLQSVRYCSRRQDPLGLISPVKVRAKLLMQSLWQLKYKWDIPLSGDLQRKWAQLENDLNTVSEDTSFSRCYFEKNHAKGQIIKFSTFSLMQVFIHMVP